LEKCLVTGATGKLGSFFIKRFSRDYEVTAGYIENPEIIPQNIKKTVIDLSDERLMRANIESAMPGFIVHCAAIKDVPYCESNPEKAREVNVEGTKKLAKICKDLKILMVYLSTDYIFEGTTGWYKENDKPNPKTYYGKTKFEAEKVVQELLSDYIIFRTGGAYGFNGDFIDFVINTVSKGEKLEAFTNIYNTPVYLSDLAENMLKIIKKGLKKTIIHIAGADRVSRFDFASKITEKFGLDKNLIIPVEYKTGSENFKRPFDCSLSSQYAREKLEIKCMGIDESLYDIKG